MAFNNQLYMSFSFISETIAESHRDKFSVLIELFYGVGIALNPLWFYLLRDWRTVLIAGYGVPAFLACLGALRILRDTPLNIITRQQPAQALADFLFIARLNRVADPDITEK